MIHARKTGKSGEGALHDGRADAPGMQCDGTDGIAGQALDARVLTGGGQTATIVLDGTRYVLRITRAGKLILTK